MTTTLIQAKHENIRTTQVDKLVDIIILSKASSDKAFDMTQRAVNSISDNRVNITVLEQTDRTYENCTTIKMESDFNYNRFGNYGARLGTSEWIMLANNDLVFHPHWLDPLLQANKPVVSPKDPLNRKQRGFTGNEEGDTTSRHFSGWCFMIKRTLWEEIGGFDEDVWWWCSDDAVIQQVKAKGILPTVVPQSQVTHLGSQTLNTTDPRTREQLTWESLDTYIKKYGYHYLQNSPNYFNWLARKMSIKV